jgi:hypothetical protein
MESSLSSGLAVSIEISFQSGASGKGRSSLLATRPIA